MFLQYQKLMCVGTKYFRRKDGQLGQAYGSPNQGQHSHIVTKTLYQNARKEEEQAL